MHHLRTAPVDSPSVIKYLGSKRTLVPVLGTIATAADASTCVDLFTGTTRVAQEFKRRGLGVTATDLASYSGILAECYIRTDATSVNLDALDDALDELNGLPARPGYVTRTFCEDARYFHPRNGARIDAIRDHIEEAYSGDPLYPILLTALLLAADRVDSTMGQQMAYLKAWAPRALKELHLRRPELLPGPGTAITGDAVALVETLPPTDLMYLDPPYNQHRYFTYYHVWETLVRWDAPAHYGVANKRVDARDASTRSVFNSKRTMPDALAHLIQRARANLLVVSYNDESWITADAMVDFLRAAGYEDVRLLAFDSRRYVGAQLGIYSPGGEKVGTVGKLRNTEYVFLAGETDRLEACVRACTQATPRSRPGQAPIPQPTTP